MPPFGRLITAMVTPFKDDLSVDYDQAAALAERLLASGSDTIVVSGTTGESPTLSKQEKIHLFETVVEAVGKRAQVIAGTGGNDTATSVALTRQAEVTGVHGILAVVPYYNKPPQEGLYQHFAAIARATRLPVMLYNVPTRTSCNLDPATTARLARDLSNVTSIKECVVEQVAAVLNQAPAGFTVYSGDDASTLPMMVQGASGVVSVVAHVAGPQIREMIAAFVDGQVDQAAAWHRRLMPLFKGMFATTNPILTKAGLELTGFNPGGVRLPLVPATEREKAALREVIANVGLL